MVKFAIPLAQGRLSHHFSECDKFAFITVKNDTIEGKVLFNPPPREPGDLPRWLYEHGVNRLIVGEMGPRAQSFFAEYGIQVITGAPNLALEELIQHCLDGNLFTSPNICYH